MSTPKVYIFQCAATLKIFAVASMSEEEAIEDIEAKYGKRLMSLLLVVNPMQLNDVQMAQGGV